MLLTLAALLYVLVPFVIFWCCCGTCTSCIGTQPANIVITMAGFPTMTATYNTPETGGDNLCDWLTATYDLSGDATCPLGIVGELILDTNPMSLFFYTETGGAVYYSDIMSFPIDCTAEYTFYLDSSNDCDSHVFPLTLTIN